MRRAAKIDDQEYERLLQAELQRVKQKREAAEDPASKTTIPSGKHKGRELSELSESSLLAMYGSWNGFTNKRSTPFFTEIYAELERRNLTGRILRDTERKPKESKKGKKKQRSYAAANCSCGQGVKLAVFITVDGKQCCDVQCTACKKAYGRFSYEHAKGMMRKGLIHFIEPAKQPKSAQHRGY